MHLGSCGFRLSYLQYIKSVHDFFSSKSVCLALIGSLASDRYFLSIFSSVVVCNGLSPFKSARISLDDTLKIDSSSFGGPF